MKWACVVAMSATLLSSGAMASEGVYNDGRNTWNWWTVVDEETGVEYASVEPEDEPTGDVVIPAVVQAEDGSTYKVASLYGLYPCSAMTSLTIHGGIRYIYDTSPLQAYATGAEMSGLFADCSALRQLKIEGALFLSALRALTEGYDDDGRTIRGLPSVTNVVVTGVTAIPQGAFRGFRGLQGVVMPDAVEEIGADAFSGCESLAGITLPKSLKSIGESAFEECSALKSVVFPEGLKRIGKRAFRDCDSLTGIALPDGIETIGREAFDCAAYWTPIYKAAFGAGATDGRATAEAADARYDLASSAGDRTIADVTVSGDTALDAFVLTDGKVYDSVLRVANTAAREVTVTLPKGYVYETISGSKPLTLPANSRSILTVTRTADRVFLVAREELETVQ